MAQSGPKVEMGVTSFEHNGKLLLAVDFKNEKHWHTYWKNPGDAGQEIDVKFYKNGEEFELSDYRWPAPKRYIEQGNMWAYGYSGQYALFYDLPDELKNATFKVHGRWLVCMDICIPEEKEIYFTSKNGLGSNNAKLSVSELKSIFNNLPTVGTTQDSLQFYLDKVSDERLVLTYYLSKDLTGLEISKKHSLVTPYPTNLFDYKHEELFLDPNGQLVGRLYIDWDGIYEEPVLNLPADNIFSPAKKLKFLVQLPGEEQAHIIERDITNFNSSSQEKIDALFSKFSSIDKKDALANKTESSPQNSLLLSILFAFLGGLILNLMPCVLPVISLKLFGLIVHSDESNKQILKHNLGYTFGVLISFVVLALTVIGLKASGQNIGWGFQLQSPLFVFIMLLVILVMSFNMFGLFEFVTPGGKTLGNMQMKKGVSGDIVNGILATILSTPCSAPFLGTALGFAFTTNNLNIFIIFLSVGLGLAFPFILTGFFPKMIKFLPKPGLWMDKLKKLLGLSLLLTAVWLYDVFSALTDMSMTGIYINSVLALIFFAFYFRKNFTKKLLPSLIVFILPILLLIQSCNMGAFDVKTMDQKMSKKGSHGIQWEKWSPEKMTASNGKITFVNFTASWCLTCKVNKKLVLDTESFSELVKDKNIELLEGDWTKRDEDITNFLKSYNIVGVPAYFIKQADGNIISLGETISIDKIKSHIK